MFTDKKALLLDMNNTFMFGEDRFGDSEDFSKQYYKIDGILPRNEINQIIRSAYKYLETKYPDEKYRHKFPTLENAIRKVVLSELAESEITKIVDTFAFHELGHVPNEYRTALHKLKQHFLLAAVIDIWAPKNAWVKVFETSGINQLFSAMSFSSDHGMVKPSPKPFQLVLNQLGISHSEGLVVGDSQRRDLGGAMAANIDCVLVGGVENPQAVVCYKNLLEFCNVF
jgi:FMN phosphatase YigB (HAD superfamily)